MSAPESRKQEVWSTKWCEKVVIKCSYKSEGMCKEKRPLLPCLSVRYFAGLSSVYDSKNQNFGSSWVRLLRGTTYFCKLCKRPLFPLCVFCTVYQLLVLLSHPQVLSVSRAFPESVAFWSCTATCNCIVAPCSRVASVPCTQPCSFVDRKCSLNSLLHITVIE